MLYFFPMTNKHCHLHKKRSPRIAKLNAKNSREIVNKKQIVIWKLRMLSNRKAKIAQRSYRTILNCKRKLIFDIRYSYFDTLKFWKTQQLHLPVLANLSVWILALQASLAASERVFSITGIMNSKLRNRLSGESIESQVLVRSNVDLLESNGYEFEDLESNDETIDE